MQIRVGWWAKDKDALRSAWEETQRSTVGRRARISGKVEHVSDPLPSVNRMGRLMRL